MCGIKHYESGRYSRERRIPGYDLSSEISNLQTCRYCLKRQREKAQDEASAEQHPLWKQSGFLMGLREHPSHRLVVPWTRAGGAVSSVGLASLRAVASVDSSALASVSLVSWWQALPEGGSIMPPRDALRGRVVLVSLFPVPQNRWAMRAHPRGLRAFVGRARRPVRGVGGPETL